MKIIKMTAAHLDAVCEIERECFAHPWSRDDLEGSMAEDTSLFLAAVDGEKVIGYIGMSMVIDEGYIFNVAVSRGFRERGVGTSLVRELITYGKKHGFSFLTLEVRESNMAAISLYKRLGFIKAGERKNYYSNPAENALLMTYYF